MTDFDFKLFSSAFLGNRGIRSHNIEEVRISYVSGGLFVAFGRDDSWEYWGSKYEV